MAAHLVCLVQLHRALHHDTCVEDLPHHPAVEGWRGEGVRV